MCLPFAAFCDQLSKSSSLSSLLKVIYVYYDNCMKDNTGHSQLYLDENGEGSLLVGVNDVQIARPLGPPSPQSARPGRAAAAAWAAAVARNYHLLHRLGVRRHFNYFEVSSHATT